MVNIDNRSLAPSTGFSHPQIKRWAVAFLDPDPNVGQHSGRARSYNFDEAVRLYLGGYLVARLKYSIGEALQILDQVFEWLSTRKWLPSERKTFERLKTKPKIHAFGDFPELIIEVARGDSGEFCYRIREVIERKRKNPESREEPVWQETYREQYFGEGGTIPTEPYGRIHLKNLVDFLGDQLCKYG
jgi:hypothetical protein